MEPFQRFLFMLLYAKGSTERLIEPVTGLLWLHKEMFLITKALKEAEDEFEPYYLGPFSEKLESYLDQLESSEYLETPSKIILTKKGEEIAKNIWKNASEEEREVIIRIKEFLNNLTNDEVLGYIYQSYPEMTEKSKVKDQIDKKKQEIAISLFLKKKVSLEKAAAIGDKSVDDFVHILKRKNIPAFRTDANFEEELRQLERST